MTKLIDGFHTVLGSDVIRDGMYLELRETDSDNYIAEIFCPGDSGMMQISFFKADLPLELIEQFIERARSDLSSR